MSEKKEITDAGDWADFDNCDPAGDFRRLKDELDAQPAFYGKQYLRMFLERILPEEPKTQDLTVEVNSDNLNN